MFLCRTFEGTAGQASIMKTYIFESFNTTSSFKVRSVQRSFLGRHLLFGSGKDLLWAPVISGRALEGLGSLQLRAEMTGIDATIYNKQGSSVKSPEEIVPYGVHLPTSELT